MSKFKEDDIEQWAIELLQQLGYHHLNGPDIAPDAEHPERSGYSDVVLRNRLEGIIYRLNPNVPSEAREDAMRKVISLPTPNLLPNNKAFHDYFINGVDVEYSKDGEAVGDKVWLVDFDNIENNEFLVINQFTVVENHQNKRPDLVLFVNGLPLVVLELKNPTTANATVRNAFDQLQTYKNTIPSLFYYNAILAASDGFEAKTGSLTAGFSRRFMQWKSMDGETDASKVVNQLEVLIKGLFDKETLLDVIRNFTVFREERKEDPETGAVTVEIGKIIAAYHQYYAVNKAVKTSSEAASEKGDRRCGVVWHTQGSGKSLSVVFYAGKLIQQLNNPTIVVLTDRNDLDDQLFDTFSGCMSLLRQTPVQAGSREELQKLLHVNSGGVVFTTVQKFFPSEKGEQYPMLSDRRNIVVIADEAHRSQYDFIDGFARHMRDALPNASFIGFTGTPIEAVDKSTRAVFGDYIDVYDIQQAVDDGATVRIFYESRLVKVGIQNEKEELDDAFNLVAEEAAPYGTEDLTRKWARLEAIVGSPARLTEVAQDFIKHFEERQTVEIGKAMFVAMSRHIAVRLYDEIIKLRPEWHNDDINKGMIKVIISGSSSDDGALQKHLKSKAERNLVANRMKDPNDELKIVIVRDMWLTGFDAPCLNTLYVDKPMGGHNLMQAIARVNRVFGDKPGGLVVDYIGVAHDLKRALATYTESGGKGKPTFDQEEAVAVMKEKFEVVNQLFFGFNYQPYFNSGVSQKMNMIRTAQEHILGQDDGKKRFIEQVGLLSKAFALAVPHPEALKIKDEVGFFQEVRAVFKKFSTGDSQQTEEVETAIRQIISGAVVSEGVVDVFDAAGIKKPDLSILSNEFLAEVQGMQHKNVAFELLKKLIRDEIRAYSETNVVTGKSFADRLEEIIRKYQNKVISTAQIIEELIALAKEMREAEKRGEQLNMSNDELAFYDALEVNDSAVKVLGDDHLREIARELVEKVRNNVSIDWTIKSSVRAKLRVLVKRTLRKYGYPPDKQAKAIETVLQQAEKLTDNWLKS